MTEKDQSKGIFHTPTNKNNATSLIMIKIRVKCRKCGWTSETENIKTDKIFQRKEFLCSKCGASLFKMKNAFSFTVEYPRKEINEELSNKIKNNLIELKMEYPYLTKEEELRTLILIGFILLGITVWDCRPFSGGCSDPVIVDGIPMRPGVGDILFQYKGRYYCIELKFIRYLCQRKRGSYTLWRKNVKFYTMQYKMIKAGGGFLVVVAETPKTEWEKGKIDTEKGCEEQRNKLREQMARSERPYECAIVDQKGIDGVVGSKGFQEKIEKNISVGVVQENALVNFSVLFEDIPLKVVKTILDIVEGGRE